MKHAIFILSVLHVSACCMADDMARLVDSGENNNGVISLNQAAGIGNQQINNRSLAVGNKAGQSSSGNNQSLLLNQTALTDANENGKALHGASIDGSSFSNSHGMIGINQSAGVYNQTSNQTTINVITSENANASQNGIVSLNNSVLGVINSTGNGVAYPSKSSNNNKTFISGSAFQGSTGVVQLNQVSGVMNQAVNGVTVNLMTQPMGH